MTKKELIDHLKHLEQYTHYSEDAPALREAIEMLKCSEMPNSSDERTDKRTGTHACDCISRQAAIDFIDAGHLVNPNEPRWSDNEVVNFLKSRPPAQPEQQWIPCSDRMPDQYGNYLVSIEGDEPDIGTINPNDPRGWSLCDANGFYWANDKNLNITAWCELPEPYREER